MSTVLYISSVRSAGSIGRGLSTEFVHAEGPALVPEAAAQAFETTGSPLSSLAA